MKTKLIHEMDKGLTLVEVVIATSVILVFFMALFGVNNIYIRSAFQNANTIKATLLAEEGLEAVRFLRDASWEDNIEVLTVGQNYGLVLQSNSWETTTDNIYTDSLFERIVTFNDVYRDSNSDNGCKYKIGDSRCRMEEGRCHFYCFCKNLYH